MRTWLPALALVVAGGCSLLAPAPDPSRFFVLTAMPPGEPVAAPGQGLVVGVGPIGVPGYLDRNEIATRVTPEELRYSALERWAEPLRTGIPRVLTEHLVLLLPHATVLRFPWAVSVPVDYQVRLDVHRFEADAQGDADLVARWTIRDVRAGADRVTRESVVQQPGSGRDPDMAVRALSATLAEVAREIATALARLGPPARAEQPRPRR